MKSTALKLLIPAFLAACQSSGTGPTDPFAKTSQPIPEAQFKNGTRTTTPAAPAVKPATKAARAPIQSLIKVVDVRVDVSVASNRSIRGFTFSDDQAEAILKQGVKSSLRPLSTGATRVALTLRVERLYIPNPGAGALLGSNYPHAAAIVQMVDARTNAPIGVAFKVSVGGAKAAGGEFRPGLIGAAMQDGEAGDFNNLARALGDQILKSVLKR
ncbi:hypothetical protein N4R57_15655 [Rhodobacteraceae bacterium D3-12]|nr:hypothetical protein N4R57_15655 [Rhodobacteraceae bacterium D3-12]